MMNAYCDRAGKSLHEVRFMFGASDSLLSARGHVADRRRSACAEGTKLRPEQLVQDVRTLSLFSLAHDSDLMFLVRMREQLDFDDDDYNEENALIIDVAQEAVSPAPFDAACCLARAQRAISTEKVANIDPICRSAARSESYAQVFA